MDITALIGKTITAITGGAGDDRMTFDCDDGTSYAMYHSQDCCESVSVDSIVGDLADLIGTPILKAEEATSADSPEGCPEASESQTWTFYKLATVKGWIDIRWHGSSNGYYSESVDFEQVTT